MSRLPAEAAPRLARGNQRATVRYRCAPATTGKLYLSGDQEFQRAWIVNLSKNGAGIVLARPLPVGAFLVMQMRGANGMVDLPAQVMYATMHNQTEWMIGCELLSPLNADELEALL